MSRYASFVAPVFLFCLLGATPPELVRVRVPSEQVTRWFPSGTEQKGMSLDALDALVREARAGALARPAEPEARLLHSKHSARWDDGVLIGRSELIVRVPDSGRGRLILDPWSPAIDPRAEAAQTDNAGRTSLRIDSAHRDDESTTVVVDWQLASRPGSRGRKFALSLPDHGTGELTLDLPPGLEPEGAPGFRSGPTTVGNLARWSFSGSPGSCDLVLIDARPDVDPDDASRLWVDGPTRVDVNDADASWTLDWSVSGGPRAPRQLMISLDPGLDLVSVTGTGVDDFQGEPAPDRSTRLTIRLNNGPGGQIASRITVRALARVPLDGRWIIPAARPVNALWAGGTTTARIAPTRVVDGLRTMAGQRIASPPGESSEDHRFDFAGERAAPVAELTFRKPRVDASAEVRGELVVGATSPRIKGRIAWSFHRGRPLGLEVDLPRAWIAERVEFEGADAAAVWHANDLPDGGSRVHVSTPPGDWAGRSLVVNLAATASVAGGRGPLALPRLRPQNARLADEIWVARVDPGLTLRPTLARGLAWLDPAAVVPTGAATTTTRPTLAWRWTADDAEARVDRERSDSTRIGTVGLVATVAPDRLSLDARVAIVSRGEPVRSITLGLTEPVANPDAWRFFEETTGLELPRTALPVRNAATVGDLGRGPSWRVDLPHPQRGRVALTAHYEGRWDDHGRIPLIALPPTLRARGTLLVLAARGVRTSVVAEGARALDPEITAESLGAEGGPFAEPLATPAYRRAHAFVYDAPAVRIELKAEALKPAGTGGVIREALLTTHLDPRCGTVRERLVLRVAADPSAQTLDVTLPDGATPERITRDGQTVTPTRSGRALSIPLSATSGARPLTAIVLDYQRERPAKSDPLTYRPARPKLSMPCLALDWEIVLPADWSVSDWGPALTPADPSAQRPDLLGHLTGVRVPGSWKILGSWQASRKGEDNAEEMLREFTTRLLAGPPEETSLGEWLTRVDAGSWPIIVDRIALASSALGPRSRVFPPRNDRSRTRTASEFLRPLGLSIEPMGRTLLLTTPNGLLQRGDDRAAWASAISQAAAWGSDTSDRFQTVNRWRDEAIPRPVSTDPPGSVDGRSVTRFFATGWPESATAIQLIDRRQQGLIAWAVAIAILTLSLKFRRGRLSARAAGSAAAVALGLVASISVPPSYSGAASGLLRGSVAVALIWLGETLPVPRRRARTAEPRSAGTPPRRPFNIALPALFMMLSLVAASTSWVNAQPNLPADAAGAIIALLPYVGPPDPAQKPDRVLLRLADYERLKSLARLATTPAPVTLDATSAIHRVSWSGPGLDPDRVVVETELKLRSDRRGSTRWAFPIEEAREIAARLDGADVPVRIEAGARSASVSIDAAGPERSFTLIVRRFYPPRRGDWGESIGVTVNPIAMARVEIAAHPAGLSVDVPSARGRIAPGQNKGEGSGWLGPTSRIDLRWSTPGGESSIPSIGTVSGLYLWDALPSGDRVRARLTYHDPGGIGVIRLGLGPGVHVRSHSIPGVVDISREGRADRPEWVARIAPPLADGSTVTVDVFRPRLDAPLETAETRSAPRVDPLGVDHASGLLAFRRPSAWSGRIEPAAGAVAIGDEAFVRSWEVPLPDDPLTLAGAVRLPSAFPNVSPAEVVTGPVPPRLRVQPRVNINIAGGRIDLSVDADLTETTGTVHDVRITCPDGFRVVRVSADGLTDWSVTSDPAPSLKLRFDGPSLHHRRARIEGWIAVGADPLAPAVIASSREINVPWPRWIGQDESAAMLTVTSPTRTALVLSPGATPVTPEPSGPNRLTYRVTRSGELGRLRWEVEPPRVAVTAQSQLSVDADSTEWVAWLRYDVSDGPLDAINLKLPSDWARGASVWLDGVPYRPQTDRRRDPDTLRESTYWSIRPDRPVWGSQRLFIRSSNPLLPGEARSFPEISPLGWGGAVDTSLRIANATSRPIAIEGSPGVQAVATQTTSADDELAASTLRAATVTSYHVIKSGWSLRVQRSDGPTAADRPRVEHGEILCTLAEDGSTLGLGRYDVSARPGTFIGVELPEGATPLWASVNESTVKLLVAGPGRWQLPLPGEAENLVALVWRSEPTGAIRRKSPIPIPIPIVGHGAVPVVVTVRAAEGVAISSPSGRLSASNVERVELEKAAWAERETAESLSGLDRSSRRAGENLVAALARFDLLLRRAQRAALYDPIEDRSSSTAQVARLLRDRMTEAVHTEALDDFQTSARASIGMAPDPGAGILAPTPEPTLSAQVRPLGRPHVFQGFVTGAARMGWLAWSRGTDASSDRIGVVILLLFVVAIPLLAWRIASISAQPRRIGRVILVTGLALIGYLAGPAWLAGSLGLAIVGRWNRA